MNFFRWQHRKDEDLNAEIRHHLDETIRDRIARGETPEDARLNAQREFGNVGLVKEVTRAMWGWSWLEQVGQDLRYGARMLAKQPGFSLIAILTLALGIGANSMLFSALQAMLLRPLPGISEANRLVQVGRTNNGNGFESVSFPDYRDYRDQNSTFLGLAAESEQEFHLGTDKSAERIKGALVTGNYFDVLGVKAAHGRLLQPAESEVEGANAVAVISARLWRKQFGGEPVAGKTISLNANPYTIIGVAEAFQGTNPLADKADIWIPITMWRQSDPWMAQIGADWLNSRSSDFADVIGRLKPSVTLEQAQADLSAIAQRLAQHYPATNAKRGVQVAAGLGLSPNDNQELRQFFGMQFGIVAIVLLIACANLAGLLLSRTAARQQELGIRMAIGAGRWRIVRQLLTESTLLALLGGLLALVIANWLTDSLRSLLPDKSPDMQAQLRFTLDGRVALFTLALSVLTGMLFGIAPAWQATKLNLLPVLKEAGNSFSQQMRSRLRSTLVVVQIALSLMLLISAGLCLRTLQNAQAINPGFVTENLLTARLDLGRQNYTETQGQMFYQSLRERLPRLPGVQSASLAQTVPLEGSSYGNTVSVEQRGQFNLRYNIVTPEYLETLGIPLLLGRQFSAYDTAQSQRVAIINETFARAAWPNENPVGKIFKWKDRTGDLPIEVIGVARDTKSQDLFQAPRRVAYLPLAQQYDGGLTLLLRTSLPPEQLLSAIQQEIRALDPRLPVYNIKTIEQYRRAAFAQKRLQAVLLSGFGLLALVLASLGLYGVLSFGVAQRTREIGIRIALGARANDVVSLVVRQGIKLTAVGILLGLAGALAVTRVLASLLYGVSPTDPLTFVGVIFVLALVALCACWVPAWRAAKVDPMIALRGD